jgi:tRNA(Arg) A34 adenosine deaminase TadA
VIDILAKMARDVVPVGASRHTAAITYKNRFVAFGHNRRKTHPLAFKYSRNPEKNAYLHAEVDCIRNALNVVDVDQLGKCTLYVCRIYKNNSLALSRPCWACADCCEAFNIKEVIYSIKENKYGVIRRA